MPACRGRPCLPAITPREIITACLAARRSGARSTRVRFGPDVEWVETLDYDVDPTRAEVFYKAVRRYYPALADGAIQPDYAGIRPKLQAPGEDARDFLVQGPLDHGIEGLVNLYGIESPGLTASLAIADYVAGLLGVLPNR